MNYTQLWAEKWRPTKLSDLLLSEQNRKFFEEIAKQDNPNIPHLMFAGPCGVGKTTLAKIIVKDILKCDYIYINASDKNSVDDVRGLITNFIQTKSLNGGMKVVILDEADGLSGHTGSGSSAQSILRNILEEYSAYSRFIFTCNYSHKIIEGLDSRTTPLIFHVDYNSYMKRCLQILKAENVRVDASQIDNLKKVIRENFPDFRKALNMLQFCSISGEFIYYEDTNNSKIIAKKCYDVLTNKGSLFELRKFLITNESDFNRDYQDLLKNLFNLLYEGNLEINKKKMSMLIVADGMHNDIIVLDKEINFMATMIKIDGIINN